MEAATVPQQPPPETEQAVLAALTLLLLSGATLAAIAPQAIPLLGALDIPSAPAQTALSLAYSSPVDYTVTGAATRHIRRTAFPRRAAYIVNAAKRLARDRDLEAERRYLGQHLNAERARMQSAANVDRAATQHGPVLGWKATMDAATTRACAGANGRNFLASRPPVLPGTEDGERIVGYPGMPHGGACRCIPVPPYPNARLLA